MRPACLLLVLALAACGGDKPAEPPAPSDPALTRVERAGRLAFGQRQLDQAAVAYKDALDKAYARDDIQAIAEDGYNLAAVELRRGKPEVALKLARAIEAELARRNRAALPELTLVQAVAQYRLGDSSSAETEAARITGGGEVAARATFVRGMIAADRGDAAALAASLQQLGAPTQGELRADKLELEGRQALLHGDAVTAKASLLAAADLRREALDYGGMARLLASAGDAGGPDAADLYLRAGRSAALQGNRQDAERWLARAKSLGDPEIAAEAERRLNALK